MKKSEYILSINPCIHGMNYHDPGAAIILDRLVKIFTNRITYRIDNFFKGRYMGFVVRWLRD